MKKCEAVSEADNYLNFELWSVVLLLFSQFCSFFLQANKAFKRIDVDKKKEELDKVKTKYGINDDKWSACFILQF